MHAEIEKQEMHMNDHKILESIFLAKDTFLTVRDTFALFGVFSSF